eukprot:CAMPEP_0184857658 /NCGR_PEP_ID=MMETSP0580-20130426/2807_1 /TAXON_ID=1118495 /ORGANISM="Dactyliosolen fragilissimus" /LENGTH=702 /DNA_ID=CAMNT_0027353377 /DNA_START=345 /DNA_END=2453 /DNA_ORIENTATION=+
MEESLSRSQPHSASRNYSSGKVKHENRRESENITPRMITAEEYDPQRTRKDILLAAKYNQGRKSVDDKNSSSQWDPDFAARAVNAYELHLRYILDHIQSQDHLNDNEIENDDAEDDYNHTNTNRDTHTNTPIIPQWCQNIHTDPSLHLQTIHLLSSYTTERALKAMLRTKIPTHTLSKRVREIERLIGSIGHTPLTDNLSLRLLEANGKAGNIGRAISLLQLRKSKRYPPRTPSANANISTSTYNNRTQNNTNTNNKTNNHQHHSHAQQPHQPHQHSHRYARYQPSEFDYAIQSIHSAALHLRKNRSAMLFHNGGEKPDNLPRLDNPTRWLDAILLNMSQRGEPLTTRTANKMLDCYAVTGRVGKASHFFYRVVRDPVDEQGRYYGSWQDMMKVTTRDNTSNENQEELAHQSGSSDSTNSNDVKKIVSPKIMSQMPGHSNRKTKIRMKMHKMPPYYKVPTEVKNQGGTFKNEKGHVISRLDWEKTRDWSPPLTAAFAFADSLTYGACGHKPITLDVASYNTLIKVCCYRGALWRAMEIINETMPQQDLTPDIFSYNTMLSGLARVGDKDFMREMLITMTNKGIALDKFTIEALVDGHLNYGDISGAISLVQDSFNQHQVLPPYTSHLKIVEFALANDLVYEAKRHVYFVQQLWKWNPIKDKEYSDTFLAAIRYTKKNPKLSREALVRLFAYFGEELKEEDFF